MKIDKSWYQKPNDPNFPVSNAAGGIVIRKENKKLLIALIGTDYYDNYMLPKGTQEHGEDIKSTAKREVVEETGIHDLKFICKLGTKERLTFKKTQWNTYHFFLFETKDIGGKQNLQEGEDDLKLSWFDFDKLPPIFWPEQKEIIEENREKIRKLLNEK